MRLLLLIFAFISVIAPGRMAFATAPKVEQWEVTELSEQTFLFDKKKISVLVDVDFAPDSDEAVAKFIRSSDFVKAMKLLRNSEDLGLEGDEVAVTAMRKQYGATYVGITESLFKSGDHSAVLTEHWWVKNHLTFHVSVLSRGSFSQSNEEQEKIFEPFAKDLGLIPGASARFDFLIPKAYAQELRRNGARTPARRATTASSQAVDCKRDAAKFGIDPAVAREGAPRLAPAFSGATCKAAVSRIWNETKKSVVDLGKDFATRSARLRRQLQCTGQPPLPKYESARRGETYYGMFSRWGRNIGTAVSYSGQSQMAANCEEAVGNGAMAQMAGNAIVGTVRGLVTVAQLTQQLQYELTVGQVRRTAQLIRYGKVADNDPLVGLAQMIGNQWQGFKCYTDREQATKLCKIGTEVGLTVASMAVGGAVSAAARLARIASVVGRAVEAEQALAKSAAALKEARALQLAGRATRDVREGGGAIAAAERQGGGQVARLTQDVRDARSAQRRAANDVRRLNMTPAERARTSRTVLGRELPKDVQDAIERAHAVGGNKAKYSIEDLREKLRIMTEAGLSREDALKLMRTGVTGEAPAASIAAAAAASTESTDKFISFVDRTGARVTGEVVGRPNGAIIVKDASGQSRFLSVNEITSSRPSTLSRLLNERTGDASTDAFRMAFARQDLGRGENMFISYVERGSRVPGKVVRTNPDGSLLVLRTDGTSVVLSKDELLNARLSQTAVNAFKEIPVTTPAVPASNTGGSIANIFRNQPARTVSVTDNALAPRNVSLPDGSSTRFYVRSDPEFRTRALREGKIYEFDGTQPVRMPPGQYTYLITNDGKLALGRVDDSFELGVKHQNLANGRPVVSAGEMEVGPDGSFKFNNDSGSFARQLIEEHNVRPQELQTRTQAALDRFMGRSGQFSERPLLPNTQPSLDTIRNACRSAQFISQMFNARACCDTVRIGCN